MVEVRFREGCDMETRTVRVPLNARAYDVHIGSGLLARAGEAIAALAPGARAAILTDATVAGHHLATLERALDAAKVDHAAHVLPAGEATKSWTHLQDTVEWLLSQRIERGDVVVALGGGVIGDLGGFAAAILRRGVRFVQIPTTLLAQVDSSVGGKTGINSTKGKNLVGAFHQPSLVLADIDLLDSLSARDFRAGYGEVMKYGLLGDAQFFLWLEENGPALLAGDREARAHAVERSIQMKAEIVTRDETEKGDRALLNLGHTFGHALEAATGYSDRLLHGEAVAIGCALAFEVSARLGLCNAEEADRVRTHITRMGLKSSLADIPGDLPDADELLDLMAQDKKVHRGRQTYVMVHGIGRAFLTTDVPQIILRKVLSRGLA